VRSRLSVVLQAGLTGRREGHRRVCRLARSAHAERFEQLDERIALLDQLFQDFPLDGRGHRVEHARVPLDQRHLGAQFQDQRFELPAGPSRGPPPQPKLVSTGSPSMSPRSTVSRLRRTSAAAKLSSSRVHLTVGRRRSVEHARLQPDHRGAGSAGTPAMSSISRMAPCGFPDGLNSGVHMTRHWMLRPRRLTLFRTTSRPELSLPVRQAVTGSARSATGNPISVSYTHLTLPTKA